LRQGSFRKKGQHANPLLTLRSNQSNARRIVYLSAPLKTAHPLFQQPNPRARFVNKRGSNSGSRGGPHQEHCIDAIEASIKRLGKSQISANYLDLWWQSSRAGVARHRADLRARVDQSRDNLAADGTGRSNNEYRIDAEQSYGRSSKGIKVVLGALLTKRPCHSSSSTMMESV